MKTDLRYTPSDCFETFPFPQPDPRTVIDSLERIGEKLYNTRATFMVDTDQGLTKTYNALKDASNQESRIIELRRLHEEMDRAVLDAYGWSDIEVPPFCPNNSAEQAALQAFEDEVIDRLYVLNAERHREELKAGLVDAKSKKGKARTSEMAPRGNKVPISGEVSSAKAAGAADSESSLTPKKSGRAGSKASAKGRKKASGVAEGDGQGDLFGGAEGES